MAKQDYYDILGVNKNSTQDEIKKAYRKKAMEYHPDRNPGNKEAEAKFKEAAEAYDVLQDADKKAAYDRFGHSAFGGGMGGAGANPFGAGFGGFKASNFNDFADIFSAFGDIFGDFGSRGGSHRKSAAMDGSDLRYNITISLEEVYSGKTANIDFTAPVQCPDCNGSGAAKGSTVETCPDCGGTGSVRRQQGFFIVENTCRRCGGTGEIIKNPCATCRGAGKINKKRELSVKIPPGIQDGNRVRLPGEGEAGTRGGRNGDLYVFVNVSPHKFFTRQGNDLLCKVPILVTTAMLGGEIEVKLIDGGFATIKIPEGTQSGNKLRLRGKGMPILNSGGRFGDLIVEVEVEVPKNLSPEDRKIVSDLDGILKTKKSKEGEGGFFKRWFK